MANISFFNEGIHFNLPQKKRLRNWIEKVIRQESKKEYIQLNFIFCSDVYLHHLNKKYLQHDSLTDIITFDYSENINQLESEIYISIDRVRENSRQFNTSFSSELNRVMIHGVLHLLGFKDKTEDQQQKMREKENECLTLYPA
jgi:probable rRNA maturation factor